MPARLRGRRILMAYGLLGEALNRLRPFGMDYMGAQLAWLRTEGARAEVVTVPTSAPVAANARRISEAILSEPEPCLLVAHSKGGLESLAALLLPGVAERCAGFIAIQSPFFGSPVADALMGTPGLHGVARWLAHTLRVGEGDGLADLTTPSRANWMCQNAEEIAALTRSLPVLCLAGRLDRATARGPDRRYLPLVYWVERHGGGPNDGLVPVESALLPGARHLVLNASHRALVSSGEGRDPVGVLREALGMI
jgi:alpha-beta hydrolase superfamily lysophospholipase